LPRTTYNDVLCAGVCSEMRHVAPVKKQRKKEKLSCVKLAICPDHPRQHSPLKFCMQGHIWEVVLYFKFHENRSRGLRAVEGRKSPSPIDLAHGLYNSLYYRIQNKFYWISNRYGVAELINTVNVATSAGWLYFRRRCGRCSISIHPFKCHIKVKQRVTERLKCYYTN